MLKLKKQYAGCYRIEGHNRDYDIDIYLSCDYGSVKMWRCGDTYFESLAVAKDFLFEELLLEKLQEELK
jgi:hypothetical protein|tara:strand:+ start:2743 stop:2949 length:207 start_codon:yes stop_codon:yes gene_type:complete